jgi:uncharacterized protein (TIGR03435 family)
MPDVSDMELVQNFTRQGSEEAFAWLVQRHVNLVYSAALRHVGNAAHAEEISQAVFIILASKAANLRPGIVLEGWLYETTRLTSLSFLRGERRRQFREHEAYMQSTLDEPNDVSVWNQMSPLLDEAMARLGKKDRDAVILRFFKDKSLGEVAAALNMTEAAAQSRVHRALEKLRKFFTRRGVALSAAAIAGAVLTNSVQAAPAALATSVTTVAISKGAAVGASTLTLIKGTLKIMAGAKVNTAIMAGIIVLLAAGTTLVVVGQTKSGGTDDSWRNVLNFYSRSALNADLANTPPQVTIIPTVNSHWGSMWGMDQAGRRLGINASITNLLTDAYDIRNTHIIFPGPMAGGKYDFIANLPQGPDAALQEKIKEQFGVTAHKAVIEINLWVLKAGDPDKLNASVSKKKSAHSELKRVDGKWVVVLEDESTTKLTDALEGWLLQFPVVDRTGLTGHYDLSLNWDNRDRSNSITALIDQLHRAGFELVASREPVEMLLVEKAN